MEKTQDIHVRSIVPLIAPRDLRGHLPITEKACETVVQGRNAVQRILDKEDDRLLAIIGPCSIHDEKAAIEYAARLAELARRVQEHLMIVMRVYFEKPRTTIGWKGLINDPYLDGTFDIKAGLYKARRILLDINELGLPCASEMLDPISPQYTADLVACASLGARTTESQTHRQMASGLSMPVGFKNATDGNLQIAFDAMEAARHPHAFLGIDEDGQTCIVNTTGNVYGHLILRGGRSGPNYMPEFVKAAGEALVARNLSPNILIDCSHANSTKDYKRQSFVWESALQQRLRGNSNIIGAMVESNLFEGSQVFSNNPSELKYGVSITDSCIGWDQTQVLVESAVEMLRLEVTS